MRQEIDMAGLLFYKKLELKIEKSCGNANVTAEILQLLLEAIFALERRKVAVALINYPKA